MKKFILAIAAFCAISAGAHASIRVIYTGFSRGVYPNCGGGGGICITPTFPGPLEPFPFSMLATYNAGTNGTGSLTLVFEQGVEGTDKINSSLNFTEDTEVNQEVAVRLKATGRLFIRKQNKNGAAKRDENGNYSVTLDCYVE